VATPADDDNDNDNIADCEVTETPEHARCCTRARCWRSSAPRQYFFRRAISSPKRNTRFDELTLPNRMPGNNPNQGPPTSLQNWLSEMAPVTGRQTEKTRLGGSRSLPLRLGARG